MSESGQEVPSAKIRVACPIDPTHTCFQNQLQKHLKICNARLEDQPPGFVRNINAGPENLQIPEKISINDLTPSELKTFVEKVKTASCEILDEERIDYREHFALKEELSRTDVSEDGALKHARQQASILGHMEEAQLLTHGNCFVEMGAGRGHINHWIQRALGNDTDSQFVLVDKQGVRYKMDALHRDENEGPKFHRLRMDIQHLKLSEVPVIKSSPSPIVVVSKHLCGAATDLTLRCCVPRSTINSTQPITDRISQDSDPDSSSLKKTEKTADRLGDDNDDNPRSRVTGVIIALCCHHRVEYRSYVGHSYLSSLGFAPRDFWLLRSLSSWATCGFENKGTSDEKNGDEEEEEKEERSDRDENRNEIENEKDRNKFGSSDENEKDRYKFGSSDKNDDLDAKSNKLTSENGDFTSDSSADVVDFKKQWAWYYEMTISQRSEIGRKCKRILDGGRISYLKTMRPEDSVRLVKYVDASTSLENVLLLVHKK